MVISRVQNIFLWVFRGSKQFSRGHFMGPKFFLVGISWVTIFFSWVFCASKVFPRGQFVDQRFFLMDISLVNEFFSRVFRGAKVFSRGFKTFSRDLFWNFQLLAAWEKAAEEYIWNCVFFSRSISTTLNFLYIRIVLQLLNYLGYYTVLVCTNCVFSHLFF